MPRDRFAGEWVELFNPGPDTLTLDGWSLDDSVDGGAHVLSGLTITSGGLLVIELARAILNNDGDAVRLLGPGGELVDDLAFGEGAADRSFSRDLDSRAVIGDTEPSPGQAFTAGTAMSQVGWPEGAGAPASLAATGAEPVWTEVPALDGSPAEADAAGPGPATRPSPQTTVGPMPTYGGSVGVRYALAGPPTATPLRPVATPAPVVVEPPADPPGPWLLLGGLSLIVLSCGLLVVNRKLC